MNRKKWVCKIKQGSFWVSGPTFASYNEAMWYKGAQRNLVVRVEPL